MLAIEKGTHDAHSFDSLRVITVSRRLSHGHGRFPGHVGRLHRSGGDRHLGHCPGDWPHQTAGSAHAWSALCRGARRHPGAPRRAGASRHPDGRARRATGFHGACTRSRARGQAAARSVGLVGGLTTSAPLRFRDATAADGPTIAALQNAAAGALTARFGEGHWSSLVTERGAVLAQRHARVRVGRSGKRIFTVLRLATRKPWAIDVSYFTPVKRPLYLTGMAVSVAHQGHGFGRLALEDACTTAVEWPADAIRLDAYDAAAGAGRFYEKCGFRQRGRVTYRDDPLLYYELLLTRKPARVRSR